MFIATVPEGKVIVLPVICPVTFDHPDGVVETTTVPPFGAPVGILPFSVYVFCPTGNVTESVNVIVVGFEADAASSIGPATTAPF